MNFNRTADNGFANVAFESMQHNFDVAIRVVYRITMAVCTPPLSIHILIAPLHTPLPEFSGKKSFSTISLSLSLSASYKIRIFTSINSVSHKWPLYAAQNGLFDMPLAGRNYDFRQTKPKNLCRFFIREKLLFSAAARTIYSFS